MAWMLRIHQILVVELLPRGSLGNLSTHDHWLSSLDPVDIFATPVVLGFIESLLEEKSIDLLEVRGTHT
jgi:hypothetical protein